MIGKVCSGLSVESKSEVTAVQRVIRSPSCCSGICALPSRSGITSLRTRPTLVESNPAARANPSSLDSNAGYAGMVEDVMGDSGDRLDSGEVQLAMGVSRETVLEESLNSILELTFRRAAHLVDFLSVAKELERRCGGYAMPARDLLAFSDAQLDLDEPHTLRSVCGRQIRREGLVHWLDDSARRAAGGVCEIDDDGRVVAQYRIKV